MNEPSVVRRDGCSLPTRMGVFELHAWLDPVTQREHASLSMGAMDQGSAVLARVHSECLTGDALLSLRCDCGPQLQAAMRAIAAQGCGVLVYLRQEGRGIGLVNKVRAYALQDTGVDTVDANRLLGLPDDARDYRVACEILGALGVGKVRLLTNNPDKVSALQRWGVDVSERVPLHAGRNRHNERYLQAKRRRMGHLIDLGSLADAVS